jgi:hypothetical protein
MDLHVSDVSLNASSPNSAFRHEPIEGAGSGKKTLAELTGNLFKPTDPEKAR